MPKLVASEGASKASSAVNDVDHSTSAIEAAIEEEISALREIEICYQALLERLNRSSGFAGTEEQWTRHVQQRQRKDRQPHVYRLADLHQRLMALTAFGFRRTVH